MTDFMAQPPDVEESWINATRGIVYVKKFGESGRFADVMVGAGRKVDLTPRERRLNQEKAYSKEQDFFSNGTLQPVRLIETEADVASIKESPNIIGDSEMKALFSEHWKTFEKRIAEITSPLLLQRMIDIANQPDSGASNRAVQALTARLKESTPKDDSPIDDIEDLG